MVLTSRVDNGAQGISVRVRKTIQTIKEVVGDHSDADIYAVLKETDMDPNETAQKLLSQDPFHEVRRRRDKKKENSTYRSSANTRVHQEHHLNWARSHTTWDRTARNGVNNRNPPPGAGINREFRVVRDNRVNQNDSKDPTTHRDVKPDTIEKSPGDQMTTNILEENSSNPIDHKPSAAEKLERPMLSEELNRHHNSGRRDAKEIGSNGRGGPLLPQELHVADSNSVTRLSIETENKPKISYSLASTNSVVGVYSSSSDLVHIPSPDSKPAKTVGTIQREVGVGGVRRQSSDRAANQTILNNSHSALQQRKGISSPREPFGYFSVTSKSKQHSLKLVPETNRPSNLLPPTQYKQQPLGHQKAMQPNMEWKPKVSQKPNADPSPSGTTSVASCAENSSTVGTVEVAGTSENISHVIIPQHLRVPDFEHIRLSFGSFGSGFDSAEVVHSTFETNRNVGEHCDEPSSSMPESLLVNTSEAASADEKANLGESRVISSRPNSPASVAESEHLPPENEMPLDSRDIDTCVDIGLVQGHSPPYTSPEHQRKQASPSLPNYSALSSHAASSSPRASISVMQQQQSLQLQQQLAQLYPQVHVPQLPNFVPYRHMFSPVYAPPMAVPNYSGNTAYPHLPNASSYLLMQGGTAPINSGSVKYATSQYKPVPAGTVTGYGNYANPACYTISTPGTIGANGLEDATRIKYKDNNLYFPSQQVEASDMWMETPRELQTVQSAPYYNMSAQTPHATYLPTHATHASFNAAAQSSHMQYPGLYHPSQPGSLASPHHLVHQQVPAGMGGSMGVGVAAPGTQVGAYQQPQLSQLNWGANM